MDAATDDRTRFASWCVAVEPRLRAALSATYGPERGREATAEAIAWAWEHRDRLPGLRNPVAYLFSVGRSRTRWRPTRVLHQADAWSEPWVEPRLALALSALTPRQRTVVMLLDGAGWTPAEVAEVLDVEVTTVRSHHERALRKLRRDLEVTTDG